MEPAQDFPQRITMVKLCSHTKLSLLYDSLAFYRVLHCSSMLKNFELFPTELVQWSIWVILLCVAFLVSDLTLTLTLILGACLVFLVLTPLIINHALPSSQARHVAGFISPSLLGCQSQCLSQPIYLEVPNLHETLKQHPPSFCLT